MVDKNGVFLLITSEVDCFSRTGWIVCSFLPLTYLTVGILPGILGSCCLWQFCWDPGFGLPGKEPVAEPRACLQVGRRDGAPPPLPGGVLCAVGGFGRPG